MRKYNYKKILDLLQQIQQNHYMIQSFGVGDINQLIYHTTNRMKTDNVDNLAPVYPLMYVIPEDATNDDRVTTYSFSILVMDIENTKNFDNQIDIWSDTLDILKDIVALLRKSCNDCYKDWDVVTPVTYSPFTEQYDDYLNGWSMKLQIQVQDPIDNCNAPFSAFNPCQQNDC